MWDKVLLAFRQTLGKAESAYLAKAQSFNCTDEENTKSLAVLRKRSWIAFRSKIDEQTADPAILGKLRAHFEERFRYDDHGIPRVWKPDDDIDGAFKKAKDQTLELLPLYSKIKPQDPSAAYELPSDAAAVTLDDSHSMDEEFDFQTTLVILPETKLQDLSSRFRKEADAYYVEAKRSTVSSIAQIPAWMYGVLVVLGWNEAMAVLFNPLYFAVLLCTLLTAYAIVRLDLVGPLMHITRRVGHEVQRQATNRLREHFAQTAPALTRPVETRPIERAFEEMSIEDEDAATTEIRRRRAPL